MSVEAIASGLFFAWFLASFLWTVNALRRPVPPGEGVAPMWLAAMLVSELAPLYLVSRALIALAFVSLGALETAVGMIGGVFFVLSELGLIPLMWRSVASAKAARVAVSPWSLPLLFKRTPSWIEKRSGVAYRGGLTLDSYRRRDVEVGPCLIYLHPGSWMRGRPGRQARPMFFELVSRGWVVLDVSYPLSPSATFPDHLVGVKRAINWAKSNAAQVGVDPDRVALSGGSSGAHLAALAALTPDHPELQPGFEAADTSVIACVPFYGIFDLLVRHQTRHDWPFVARHVVKATSEEAPDLYRLGSPLDQVRADAPPFLVVHGEFDSIVLAQESQHFVGAFRRAGAQATYHEVRGGQHGFDTFASLRSRAIGKMAGEWLDAIASDPVVSPEGGASAFTEE